MVLGNPEPTRLARMAEVQGVAIEVETADVLAVASDVLVLKHAQVSLGIDAVAKERLGLDLEMELPPGRQLVVRSPGTIGPHNVVFLGVPPFRISAMRRSACLGAGPYPWWWLSSQTVENSP
jgi:hypothetical protein